MNLEKLREKIDLIDLDILRLLNERVELALQTRRFKSSVYDRERERLLYSRLKDRLRIFDLIPQDLVKKLFKEVVDACRGSQSQEKILLGFQGEHGAYGEEAARCYDPDLVSIPCGQFSDVFDAVENGHLDLGMVPVENSLGGAITEVNELLMNSSLKINSGIRLRINHCLLVPPGTDYREIKILYSHPQALSQCRAFINRHEMEAITFYDTAGAAKMLAKEKPKMAGAVASRLCAELYGLDIIKEHIEDCPVNFTRFVVLSRKENQSGGDKCSILFSTPHKAGALFEILQIFSEAGINLTRIESLPDRSNPGNYYFFLDFQSHDLPSRIQEIFPLLEQKVKTIKNLGCYDEETYQ